jgi:CheY-like chemotaxis protein
MDLGLPGINGIEATQRLKKNPQTANIPVIAHTAWPEESFRSEGEKVGLSGFLTKPTSPIIRLTHLFNRGNIKV